MIKLSICASLAEAHVGGFEEDIQNFISGSRNIEIRYFRRCFVAAINAALVKKHSYK